VFTMNGCLQVSQGKLVAVEGGHGSGKNTLLRLIAHELFPTSGAIFVPSHLRILHVSQEVLLLRESAWHNLTFGCRQPLSDLDLQRVELVAERLGMHRVMQLVQPDLAKAKKENALGGQPKDPFASTDTEAFCSLDCFTDAEEDSVDLRADWLHELTYSDKVKVHLVRAFLMNPEVMVLQRPLHHF